MEEEKVGRRTEPSKEESGERRAEDWLEPAVSQVQPAFDFPSPSRGSPSRSLARKLRLSGLPIGWAPSVTERVGLAREPTAAGV